MRSIQKHKVAADMHFYEMLSHSKIFVCSIVPPTPSRTYGEEKPFWLKWQLDILQQLQPSQSLQTEAAARFSLSVFALFKWSIGLICTGFYPKYLFISHFIVSIQRRNILLLNPTWGAFQTQIYPALRSLNAPPFVIVMSLSVMSYSTTCFRTALPSVSFQHTRATLGKWFRPPGWKSRLLSHCNLQSAQKKQSNERACSHSMMGAVGGLEWRQQCSAANRQFRFLTLHSVFSICYPKLWNKTLNLKVFSLWLNFTAKTEGFLL